MRPFLVATVVLILVLAATAMLATPGRRGHSSTETFSEMSLEPPDEPFPDPGLLSYQAMVPPVPDHEEPLPGHLATQQDIPINYVLPDFANPTPLEAMNPPQPEAVDAPAFATCDSTGGFWTGATCAFEGEDCSPDGVDQVHAVEAGECVALPQCQTGTWLPEAEACALTGDDCSTDALQKVWAEGPGGLECTSTETCTGAWFDPENQQCLVVGEACAIRGQTGVVAQTDGESRCQLTMSFRPGFRLASGSTIEDSEVACYETCVARSDGCAAYSFDDTTGTCQTGGSSSLFALHHAPSRLAITPRAAVHPHFEVVPAEGGAAVTWESFNATGFRVLASASPDMTPPLTETAEPGALVPIEPGGTRFFQADYDLGNGSAPLPVVKSAQTADAPVTLQELLFRAEPEGQMLSMAWALTLEPGMQTRVRFPDDDFERDVHPHGAAQVRYDAPGTKTFSVAVYSGEERVYFREATVEITCDPGTIAPSGLNCLPAHLQKFEMTVNALAVNVAWTVIVPQGTITSLSVDNGDFQDVAPTGSVDTATSGPREVTATLRASRNGVTVLEETRVVQTSCAEGDVEFGGSCVPECAQDPPGGAWKHDNTGVCVLECAADNRVAVEGACVLRAGELCDPDGNPPYGAFLANGAGACTLHCDTGFAPEGGVCLQQCAPPPQRATFSHTPDGLCFLECEPGNHFLDSVCVETCEAPPVHGSWSHDFGGACVLGCEGSTDHGTWVTNASGSACQLSCEPGFVPQGQSCAQDCTTLDPPGTGASFILDSQLMCELAFDDPARMHVVSDACVLRAGEPCEPAPAVGTLTADGAGACIRGCPVDYVLDPATNECYNKLKIIEFDVQSSGQTISVAWSVTLEPGMSLKLERPDKTMVSVGAIGSTTFTNQPLGSRSVGLRVFGPKGLVDGVTEIVEVTCSSDSRPYENETCVIVGDACGSDPVNGTRTMGADGVCSVICSPGDTFDSVKNACVTLAEGVAVSNPTPVPSPVASAPSPSPPQPADPDPSQLWDILDSYGRGLKGVYIIPRPGFISFFSIVRPSDNKALGFYDFNSLQWVEESAKTYLSENSDGRVSVTIQESVRYLDFSKDLGDLVPLNYDALPCRPVPANTNTTPVQQPDTPAPVQQPTTPAPVQQPTTPAPVQQPANPAPVQQPATPAPVQQPATPAPVQQPETPAPSSQPEVPFVVQQVIPANGKIPAPTTPSQGELWDMPPLYVPVQNPLPRYYSTRPKLFDLRDGIGNEVKGVYLLPWGDAYPENWFVIVRASDNKTLYVSEQPYIDRLFEWREISRNQIGFFGKPQENTSVYYPLVGNMFFSASAPSSLGIAPNYKYTRNPFKIYNSSMTPEQISVPARALPPPQLWDIVDDEGRGVAGVHLMYISSLRANNFIVMRASDKRLLSVAFTLQDEYKLQWITEKSDFKKEIFSFHSNNRIGDYNGILFLDFSNGGGMTFDAGSCRPIPSKIEAPPPSGTFAIDQPPNQDPTPTLNTDPPPAPVQNPAPVPNATPFDQLPRVDLASIYGKIQTFSKLLVTFLDQRYEFAVGENIPMVGLLEKITVSISSDGMRIDIYSTSGKRAALGAKIHDMATMNKPMEMVYGTYQTIAGHVEDNTFIPHYSHMQNVCVYLNSSGLTKKEFGVDIRQCTDKGRPAAISVFGI